MNTLNQSFATSQAPDESLRFKTDPQPATHILVLVPSLELDLTDAARKVWELAHAGGAQVHFVSLYIDPVQEAALRRGLTTLASLVQDNGITVDIEVLPGRNWLDVVNAHPADMIVCFPEKKSHAFKSLAQLDPPVPLYIFSAPEKDAEAFNLPSRLAAWSGSLAILISFFFIQDRLIQVTPGGLHSLMLVLSTLVEFGSIWFLNMNF